MLAAGLIAVLTPAISSSGVAREPAPAPKPGWPQRLTLAVLPSQVPPHNYNIWVPLAEHLAGKIGIPVKLTTSNAYEKYLGEVLTNTPELAFVNGLQYLTAHRDGGYEAFVAPAQRMTGRIIVRIDSPIKTIGDLRGKTIAFLPPSAMPGHLQPKAFLLDHGLAAGQDYRIVEVENHNLSINAVVVGRVDAGATGVTPFETMPNETKAKLRILAETPPQSPPVIAVRRDLVPTLKEAIAEALLALDAGTKGRAVLAPLGWKKMIRVTDADYDITREFARKLGLRY